jgi:hypothetical protein
MDTNNLNDAQRAYLDALRVFVETDMEDDALQAEMDRLWYALSEQEQEQVEPFIAEI